MVYDQHNIDTEIKSNQYVSRRAALGLLGLGSSVFVAGCLGDDAGNESADAETASDDSPQTGGTLNIAVSSSVDNMDPAYTQLVTANMMQHQMVERLFQINDDLEIKPHLAADYEVHDNAQRWDITLREGVMFHEPYSREMVADDVAFNLNRIRDPDTGAAGAGITNPIEDIEVHGDYELTLQLASPQAAYDSILSVSTLSIVSPDLIRETGDARGRLFGTGPFKFEQWEPGDRLILTKNDEYWQDNLPYVDQVVFRPISEPAVQVTEIRTGDINILSSTPPDFIDNLEDDDSLQTDVVPSGEYTVVHINSAPEPIKNRNPETPTTDVRVRRAINEALDRNGMNEAAMNGLGTVTQEFYPEFSPWHIGYDRYSMGANPERARELLDEAGYTEPVPLTIISSPDDDTLKQMGVVAEANLRDAGFDPTLKEYEIGTWVDVFFAHEWDICVNFFPTLPDPAQKRQFYDPDGVYIQPYVDGNNSSDEVMALFDQGDKTSDFEQRYEIYKELQMKFFDDSVAAIMYHEPRINTYRESVRDYAVHPYGQQLNIEYAWLSE